MRSFQVKLTIKTDGSLQVQVINKTIITRIKMLHMHAVFTLPAHISAPFGSGAADVAVVLAAAVETTLTAVAGGCRCA